VSLIPPAHGSQWSAWNQVTARTSRRFPRFAMHSIGQLAAARAQYGRGRYSLWTGDVGVAIYLRQCIAGTSGLPSLDF